MLYLIPTDTCFWLWCAIDDVKTYHKIYSIKKRPTDKPLSIMVLDFTWLEKNTDLNTKQIDFLKKYKKPFTILCECPRIKMLLDFEQEDFNYENNDVYQKIAFRVAHNDEQKKLIKEIWPIFLTSANFSWKPEIYDVNEAKIQFEKYQKHMTFLWKQTKLTKIPPSDIFEFIWDSTDIKFLRQN